MGLIWVFAYPISQQHCLNMCWWLNYQEIEKFQNSPNFAGETNESTVEHIVRYLIEAGDIANNENLKLKYFPSSLTKNAFTWFTTLPPNSIHCWTQLEKAFHGQFYMGQCKISLKELANVRRRTHESIDDYLNRFRLIKARCFTVVVEHELVKMAAGGLDYEGDKNTRKGGWIVLRFSSFSPKLKDTDQK